MYTHLSSLLREGLGYGDRTSFNFALPGTYRIGCSVKKVLNLIELCSSFMFINHKAPLLQPLSSPFISPSPLLLLFSSNISNSPLHSIPEHSIQHLPTPCPAEAPFLSLNPLFTPTLTQIQELPWLESLETDGSRLGRFVIKSAVVRNELLAP